MKVFVALGEDGRVMAATVTEYPENAVRWFQSQEISQRMGRVTGPVILGESLNFLQQQEFFSDIKSMSQPQICYDRLVTSGSVLNLDFASSPLVNIEGILVRTVNGELIYYPKDRIVFSGAK